MTIDEAIKRLSKARKKLDAEQGRVARRNARQAVLAALRAVRGALDAEFPAYRKPKAITVKMDRASALARKKQRLAQKGAVRITAATAANLLAADVPVESVTERGTAQGMPTRVTHYYVERWVVAAIQMGLSRKSVAYAVRSRSERAKINGAMRLGGAPGWSEPFSAPPSF